MSPKTTAMLDRRMWSKICRLLAMRKVIFISVLSTALLLSLYGCGARSKSSGHVRPVIAALESYHRDHNAYPTNLTQLSPDLSQG